MATERDVRQEVTDRILAALEQGTMPWRRGWTDDKQAAVGLPSNAATGRVYNGGNRMILLAAGMSAGYQDNRWLTFNQAKSLDGGVKKGEKGVAVEFWDKLPFWKRRDVTLEVDGKPVKLAESPAWENPVKVKLMNGREVPTKDISVVHDGKRHTWRQAEQVLSTLFSKAHTVFNVEQCNGLKIEPIQIRSDPEFGRAGYIVEGMKNDGVSLSHGGNRAFYNPGRDSVQMPHQDQFESNESYLGTLLHELGHATGHADRNSREFGGVFGSPEYAREELVAELTSAFVAAETGIGFGDENHAAYIGSWIEALGKDKHELFRAATAASKAADYLIERGKEVEQERSKGRGQEGGLEEAQAPELAALRKIWTEKGVSAERQEELLADIAAKAAPGAQVGPFRVPGRPTRQEGVER
ncbi:ArdC family protein [Azonexus sp.]|uniref:ArdC family protein n=1 Tax=Azonexus sp. TaxID=1872668 RepID=UPI0039E2C9EF